MMQARSCIFEQLHEASAFDYIGGGRGTGHGRKGRSSAGTKWKSGDGYHERDHGTSARGPRDTVGWPEAVGDLARSDECGGRGGELERVRAG